MSDNKMEGIKIIGDAYKLVKPLFQVRSYFYAQVCCITKNYEILNAALYVYENEDPSQSLKMLCQKLGLGKVQCNIIFPYKHLKYPFSDKNISLFFIRDYLIPFRYYIRKQISVIQILEILYGALSCLHHLHLREVVHGNISLNTCYMVQQKSKESCKFALNILDTTFFTEEDSLEGIQERLFLSQGQTLGQKPSFKDDIESLVYVLVHLLSKGKMFHVRRFQIQWVIQSQFLRWKSCDFFKEMTKIIPPELQILIQIYAISKSLHRNEKPNYIKLMKKLMSQINYIQKKINSKKGQQWSRNNTNEENQLLDEKDITMSLKKMKQEKFKENAVQDKLNSCQKIVQAR